MKNNSKALEFIYQDVKIHFLLSNDENVMINATEMAKTFGKRPIDFLRLDSTKNLIETICKDKNFNMIFGVGSEEISLPNRKNKIFETKSTGKNNGTWMHKILALEFAAWLDQDFRLWILITIEDILLGHYKQHWDAHIKQESAKDKMEKAKSKLLIEATQEDVLAYFEAEKEFKDAKNEKLKAIHAQYKLF
jgi:hypothetical protein